MTFEEARDTVQTIKTNIMNSLEGEDMTEEEKDEYANEEMLEKFYRMYQKGELDINGLEAFTKILGYEFTDEFRNMSEEDKKTMGVKEREEEVSEEVEEEVKDPGANDEEKGNKPQSEDKTEKVEKQKSPSDDEYDESQKKKAMSYFGLDD